MPKKRLDTALYIENQLKYFALSNLPNFFNFEFEVKKSR